MFSSGLFNCWNFTFFPSFSLPLQALLFQLAPQLTLAQGRGFSHASDLSFLFSRATHRTAPRNSNGKLSDMEATAQPSFLAGENRDGFRDLLTYPKILWPHLLRIWEPLVLNRNACNDPACLEPKDRDYKWKRDNQTVWKRNWPSCACSKQRLRWPKERGERADSGGRRKSSERSELPFYCF